MKFLQILILLLVQLFCVCTSSAQELKANVIVTTDQLQGNRLDKQLQTDMQSRISDFINNYKWTEHTFKVHEKINCTFQISITSFSGSRYKANVVIAASRPIYNSTYETQVFNYSDMDWEFEYSQSSTISYSENAYVNSLSSLISFYVYMIMAYDYDSFSKFGGQQYLEKAMQIMNSAQATDDKGWKQGDGNNVRYWLVENLMNPQQQALREVTYKYHRKALDKFSDQPDNARAVIFKCIEDIKQMNVLRPNTLTMKWFFVMKYNELVQVFSKAPKDMKQKVFDMLRELDPTHITYYENILKNN